MVKNIAVYCALQTGLQMKNNDVFIYGPVCAQEELITQDKVRMCCGI